MFDPDNPDYLLEAAQNGLIRTDGFPDSYFPDSVEDSGPSEFMTKRFAEFEESGSPEDFEFFHLEE